MGKRKGIKILNGRATYYSATSSKGPRVALVDPVTAKRRVLSATSREHAEQKAREALGDWDENHETSRIIEAPTVREAFDSWVDASRSKWVERTVGVYQYRFTRALSHLSDAKVTAVRPSDLHDVAMDLSREQAKRLRTVVRGTFDTVERWTNREGRVYAEAVRIPGSKSDEAPRQVEKSQIPSTEWVTGTINCLYSTCQLHPALSRPGEHLDEITGEHTHPGFEELSSDVWFISESLRLGAPQDIVNGMRRGIPKHYSDPSGRRRDETFELASRFRQIALITALGAGGALRIGEVLALRPRHLFGLSLDQNTARQITMGMNNVLTREINDGNELNRSETLGGMLLPGYRGRIDVVEQVSPVNSGRMAISAPKMGKNRTVWLAPLLYPSWDTTTRSLRELLTDSTSPGYETFDFELFHPNNRQSSLWSMTEYDALKLWSAGYVPLPYLLHDRLREIWLESDGNIRTWWDSLLFPTRNPGRARGNGPLFPDRWPYGKDVPTGTFQSPANLTHRYVSPIYDYVSETLHNWPGYKGNGQRANTSKPPRKGWTHHGLRHWAISQWLGRGTSVSTATRQAGHKNEAFTLSRYSWALSEHLPQRGFEP